MLGEERQNTELSVQKKLQAITDCCEQFSGGRSLIFKDKGIDYFMTEEFRQIQSQIKEAFSFQQEINLYKKSLGRKLKSTKKTEDRSTEEDINLQLISKDSTYIEKLKKIHTNLILFENKAKNDIIVKRTNVPQEYAGLSRYKVDQNQYLVATANMMPCVGVAFYCKDSKAGMVIHFDHLHNDLAEIEKYFSKLFDLITKNATDD